jgi:hypothetical protein
MHSFLPNALSDVSLSDLYQGLSVTHPYLHAPLPLIYSDPATQSSSSSSNSKEDGTAPQASRSHFSLRPSSRASLKLSSPSPTSPLLSSETSSTIGSNNSLKETQSTTNMQGRVDEKWIGIEEERDSELVGGGDSNTPSPLLFLQKGFRELLKCRQVQLDNIYVNMLLCIYWTMISRARGEGHVPIPLPPPYSTTIIYPSLLCICRFSVVRFQWRTT